MYIAKLAGHVIEPGTNLEIQDNGLQFAFIVQEVKQRHFVVRWTKGENAGERDTIPFSLFEGIGQPITIMRVEDHYGQTLEPNQAWLYKRLKRNE